MLVNTSFNVRGEPIVCTPEDAYRCFLATDMDALVLEDVILLKQDVAQQLDQAAREDTWRSFSWTEIMQWSDVVALLRKVLRQFAGLCLVVFGAIVALGLWRGRPTTVTTAIAAAGIAVGLVGLVWPAAVRWIYTGWMIAVFPIGWTISRLMLAILFYLVFTPIALVFRLIGRDVLRVRQQDVASHWTPKPGPTSTDSYFGQF